MTRCEWCDTRIEDGELVCPSCLREVRDVPRAAANAPEPKSETVAAAQAIPEPAAPEVPAGPQCPVHAEMPSGGTCSRCGRFVCIRCVPDLAFGGKAVCPECVERTDYADAQAQIPKLLRSLPVWFGVFALIYLALGALLVRAGERNPDASVLGAVTLISALGIIFCIVMLIRSREGGWGWGALVFMVGVPAASMILVGARGTPGILGFIIVGRIAWGLLKLHGYQALVKEHDARKLAAAQEQLAQRPTVM